MNKVIVLDFSDGKVKIIYNISKDLQIEEIEEILVNEYNFSLESIEYMIVSDLIIENLD